MCREIGGREKVQMPLSVFRMQKRARTRPQKRASKNLEPSVTDYLRKCRNDEDRPRHQAERNCKRLNQATPYCTSSQVSFGREVCCTKYRECGDFYRRHSRGSCRSRRCLLPPVGIFPVWYHQRSLAEDGALNLSTTV